MGRLEKSSGEMMLDYATIHLNPIQLSWSRLSGLGNRRE